jgi:hypothetical protein
LCYDNPLTHAPMHPCTHAPMHAHHRVVRAPPAAPAGSLAAPHGAVSAWPHAAAPAWTTGYGFFYIAVHHSALFHGHPVCNTVIGCRSVSGWLAGWLLQVKSVSQSAGQQVKSVSQQSADAIPEVQQGSPTCGLVVCRPGGLPVGPGALAGRDTAATCSSLATLPVL